ncbi:MAG: hypoxanthine phosphoribosyltransferase [Bacteroidales bacterium]|jgi:hypoxanthine phosphoribosyltransferase|nr:hypoxanthine phosphoribosyltransferase [Bacteroidales bacterium]
METTNISFNGEEFKPFIDEAGIAKIINDLAEKINSDCEGKDPIFLVVLNGAFMFSADLLKRITIPCRISFVKMASYSGKDTTGKIKELIGINEDLKDQNIVVLEDIIDTGITMEYLLDQVNEREPASVKICTMFFKPDKFQKSYPIDYVGKIISNEFIIGYGLDLDGYVRNLPAIYQHT